MDWKILGMFWQLTVNKPLPLAFKSFPTIATSNARSIIYQVGQNALMLVVTNYVRLQNKLSAHCQRSADRASNEISEWSNKLLLQCHALRDEISLFARCAWISSQCHIT